MDIRDLSTTPLTVVVDSLLRAFEGYFVPMPKELAVWEQRFARSGASWSRSYGAFHDGELVAFIIHAMGDADGRRTAFNTGTGVVPEHRGKRLVDALYAHALIDLRRDGVEQCALEVITKNEPAVRVYERIGFHRAHTWKCFQGKPKSTLAETLRREDDPFGIDLGNDGWYSWDHRLEALRRNAAGLELFRIGAPVPFGHVLLDPNTGRVSRINVKNERDPEQWRRLIAALTAFNKPIRFVNVHPDRKELIHALLEAGLINDIDQFEMRLSLKE